MEKKLNYQSVMLNQQFKANDDNINIEKLI